MAVGSPAAHSLFSKRNAAERSTLLQMNTAWHSTRPSPAAATAAAALTRHLHGAGAGVQAAAQQHAKGGVEVHARHVHPRVARHQVHSLDRLAVERPDAQVGVAPACAGSVVGGGQGIGRQAGGWGRWRRGGGSPRAARAAWGVGPQRSAPPPPTPTPTHIPVMSCWWGMSSAMAKIMRLCASLTECTGCSASWRGCSSSRPSTHAHTQRGTGASHRGWQQ